MNKEKKTKASIDNIYTLNGKVPLGHAVPFGLQHILAMFVANIAPIIIVANACKLSNGQIAMLIQSAMLIAGIGTLIQLFPIWRVGSGLPIVMGISFTFVSILCFIGTTYGYETIVGAVLVGGILEGTLGLFCKVLAEVDFTDCSSECCYCNWFFSAVGWFCFVWRRKWK